MKLHCNVEVNNRSMPGVSMGIKRKSQRSCLAIGRQTLKSKELHFLLQTQTNKQGVTYRIENNVEQVFTKFIDDGKATIRLKEPSHDLIIKADSLQLKSFLRTLKLVLGKNADPSVLSISNLLPKSLPPAPKTKVTINKASNYPTLEGFPKTTEELYLIGLNRRSFDRQILKLQSLRILDLSNNQLSSLPKELGTLPNLQELVISNNQLGKNNKWTWLDQITIVKKLKRLEINCNAIQILPQQIGKLSALVTLQVNQNLLTCVPQCIGSMVNLKYLDLSKNKLNQLPGSIKNLKLVSLDVSENAFEEFIPKTFCQMDVSSLVEYCAKSVLKTRIWYTPAIIPLTLVKYLDEANYCICSTPCFETYIRKPIQIDLKGISELVKFSGNCTINGDTFFCSLKCLRRHLKIRD